MFSFNEFKNSFYFSQTNLQVKNAIDTRMSFRGSFICDVYKKFKQSKPRRSSQFHSSPMSVSASSPAVKCTFIMELRKNPLRRNDVFPLIKYTIFTNIYKLTKIPTNAKTLNPVRIFS